MTGTSFSRTLQSTCHQSHANRQWSQDSQFRINQCEIHRLHELFSHGFVELSKIFGIHELKKGFYPHFFNTQQYQNYAGYMPDKSYYDPDGMSTACKDEFHKWYDEKVSKRYIFNFQHEL